MGDFGDSIDVSFLFNFYFDQQSTEYYLVLEHVP